MNDDWTILHGGALGDLVLATQFALQLPRVGTGSTLTLIARSDLGVGDASSPRIRRISADAIGLHALYMETGNNIDGVPVDARPRAAVDERLHDAVAGQRVLSFLGGADHVTHARLRELEPAALISIDPRPDSQSVLHITAQWRRVFEAQAGAVAKCARRDRPTTLRVSNQRGGALRNTAHPAHGAIVIHPGGGSPAKCWRLAGFVGVARRLAESGEYVRFVVGPVELERWPATDLALIEREFPLTPIADANELAATLAVARVLIGNDSGPAHLAALLGTPTVTLFGPTDARVWRPLAARGATLQGELRRHAERWGIEESETVAAVLRIQSPR